MKKVIANISILSFLSALLLTLPGCSDDDDNIVEKEQDLYEKYVTPELEGALDDLGITINRGVNPPDITGYFYEEEPKCIAVTRSDDTKLGETTHDKKIRFYNKKELSINMEGWELDYKNGDNVQHVAEGVFLSGEGDRFSIFFNEEYTYDNGAYGTLFSVYSGEVRRDNNGKITGLGNLQYAILMRENNGFDKIMPNGSGRLFESAKVVKVITKESYESLGNTTRSGHAGSAVRSATLSCE